jgi:serine/threonine protein kinase/WD40 repeat protein
MSSHPNYELFEEIGRTDTTVVYRAHDLALGRDVAIKELTAAGKADPQRQERFLREAQFLAQTEHAGILRVHTVVPEQGWIVMELMKGNLASQIEHQPMGPDTVRSILRQLLSALEFLHQRGKLHGAIRPSNILIDDQGSVRLSDFEQTDLDGELRTPTSTKKYLAPEWIRSQFGPLGPQSDLYCLAFTAVELLAGNRFDSLMLDAQSASVDPDVAWLRKHSSVDPLPATAKLIPTVPPDMAAALDAMLQKQVEDRPATAEAAVDKLDEQAIVAIEPVVPQRQADSEPSGIMPAAIREINPLGAAPASRSAADAKHENRKASPAAPSDKLTTRDKLNRAIEKPYVLYPLCAAMLLAALGVGLYLRSDRKDGTTKLAKLPDTEVVEETVVDVDPQQPESGETTEEPLTEETIDPDTIDFGELTEMIEVPAAFEPRLVEAAAAVSEEIPEEIPDVEPEENVDSGPGETAIAEVVTESEPEKVPSGETTESPELVDPLAGFLELVSKEVEVDTTELLADFKGNPELVLDAGGFLSEVSDVAIDPLGRWVAACGDKVVRLWSLESGELIETLRGDRLRTSYGDCNTIAFSPDGNFLLVGVGDYQPHGAIRVYRTDAFAEIEALLPGHTSPVRRIDFSRDGKLMTSVDADGNIAVWDWPQRRQYDKITPRDPAAPIVDELHFAGAEPVLFGIDNAGPFLLDAATLNQLTAADPLPSRLHAWMVDLLTGNLVYPFQTDYDPRVVDLQLDQNVWAAAGVGKENGSNKFWVGVWNARELDGAVQGTPANVYSGHRWQIETIDLAPSLGLAASADKFGEVHVWKLGTGELLYRFRGQGKPVYEAAFDLESSRIGFGVTPYGADIWGRNNYGAIDKVLDLGARSIYAADANAPLSPIEETPRNATHQLRVKRINGDAGLSVVKSRGGQDVARYDLTSGRIPTVLTLLGGPVLDVNQPAIIGDDVGLLAVWDSDTDRLKRAFIGHETMVTSVSVAPHGRAMLSGSTDRTIRVWSLIDPVPTGIFDFKFENAVVTEVVDGSSSHQAGVQVADRIDSIDGKSIKKMYELMLTGEFDYRPGQIVSVQMSRNDQPFEFEMRLDQGYDFSEPILSIYVGDQDRWIAWTPQGYYDAAPGAEELIGWHVNRGPDKAAAYFSVGQFREQLYRPDIIDRLLGGQSIEEAVRESNQDHDDTVEVDFRSPSDLALHHPPNIEIISPIGAEDLNSRENVIEAVITSPNGLPIREVTLLVNGVTTETFGPQSAAETRMEVKHPIELSLGSNVIELVASNGQSRGFADTLVEVVADEGEPSNVDDQPNTDLRVLSIGIAKRSESPNDTGTTQAIDDAKFFAETMKAQAEGKLYRQVTEKVLLGPQATRSAILDGFQSLIDQTRPGDTVAIYVASDTFIDSSQNYYIGTHDVDLDRPRATAISWREFVKTLQTDLPGCKRLVFLDLDPSEQALKPGLRNPLLDLAAPELGTVFFSSTALQQRLPAASGNGRSFLTQALRQILGDSGADVAPRPPDGLLSCEEASLAWMKRVRGLSSGRLYPIAFAPAASGQINVFQLDGEGQPGE